MCIPVATPKAFASSSPGLEQPWVYVLCFLATLKALAITAFGLVNTFSVAQFVFVHPGLDSPGFTFYVSLQR